MYGEWEAAKDQGSFELETTRGRSYVQCKVDSWLIEVHKSMLL